MSTASIARFRCARRSTPAETRYGFLDERIIAISGQSLPVLMVCKILCFLQVMLL
jgi:hypothetical protein